MIQNKHQEMPEFKAIHQQLQSFNDFTPPIPNFPDSPRL